MEITINRPSGVSIDMHPVNEQGMIIGGARTMQVEMPRAELDVTPKPKTDIALQFIQQIALAAGIIRLTQEEYTALYVANKLLADRFYFVMDEQGLYRIYAGKFMMGERSPEGEVKPTNHFPLTFPIVF